MEPPRTRRPRSLVSRLTLVSTAATAVALTVLLGGLFLVVTAQLQRAVDDGLLARSQDAADALSAAEPFEPGALIQVLHDGAVERHSSGLVDAAPLVRRTVAPAPGQSLLLDARLTRPGRREAIPLRVVALGLPDGRVLVLGTSRQTQEDAAERLLVGLAFAGPALLAMVAVVVHRTARAALRPVDALTREAGRITAAHDTGRRLPAVAGDDEVARLARTLDAMLERLGAAFERERAFVDDASHELRTPIAVLRGELELALSDLSDAAGVAASLRAALREAERLGRLADDLLALAKDRSGVGQQPYGRVELREVLTEAAARLASVAGVTAEVRGDEAYVPGEAHQWQQIVGNLLVNAGAAGARQVRLSVVGSGSGVELAVEDDGPGFPPAFLPVAFERFSRADAARTRTTGAGLGLPIVAAVARACGGDVTASNDSALGGAAVRLRLPRADTGALASARR